MNDKQNARIVYADIINLPHFQSTKRPHMSLYDRAAQFAPFAALTGFDDMVIIPHSGKHESAGRKTSIHGEENADSRKERSNSPKERISCRI